MPPISLDQAFATPASSAPPPAPSSDPPPKPATRGISLDEAFKAQEPAPAKPPEQKPQSLLRDTLRDAAKPVTNWWPEFVKQSNAAIEDLQKDVKDVGGAFTSDSAKPGDVKQAWKGMGNFLLDLGGALWSPVSAAVSTVAVQPLQIQVSNAGEFIKRTMAAPGAAPKGGDAKIHAQDVDNTVRDVNEFLDFTIQTAAGLVTPGGAEAATRIRPKAVEEIAGLETTPIKAAEEKRATAAKKVEDAFSELIAKNEEAANKIAVQVAGSNPEVGKAMKRHIVLKAGQSLEDALKEGEQHAKTQVESNRYELAEKDPHWGGVHNITIGAFEHLFKAGAKIDAGKFADILKDAAGPQAANNEYAYRLLDRLSTLLKGKKYDIHFIDKPYLEFEKTHPDGTTTIEKADGMHMGSTRKIELASGSSNPVLVAVHEMVHAVTSNFIRDNPTHALTLELQQLYDEALTRYQMMDPNWLPGSKTHIHGEQYGFYNLHEFIAEAFSNPDFQSWLAHLSTKSSMGFVDKAKSYYDKFAAIVGKVLGVRQMTDAQLLHGVMSVSNKIMDKQAGVIVSRAAAGIRTSAREVVQAAERQSSADVIPNWDSLLRAKGKQVASRDDAVKALGDGDRVFIVDEMDERAHEIRNTEELKGATADQITVLSKHDVPGNDVQASAQRTGGSKPPPSGKAQDPWNPRFSPTRFGMLAQGKAKGWWESALRNVWPEGFGANAKTAAATVTAHMAEVARKTAVEWYSSLDRRREWESHPEKIGDFVKGYEIGGIKFKDPWLERARLAYTGWAKRLELQDRAAGVIYEPIDHYFPHIWDNPKAVAEYFDNHFPGWNKPGFTMPRGFDRYDIGLKAGFKLRFTNPEDIMLARQHASDLAHARIGIFQDLERFGLAVEDTKGMKVPPELATKASSPDGKKYWIHPSANKILHNAFETESLWNKKGVRGDLYRGAMWLKNTIVPVELALSLFHPLHVATIDNATDVVRATKGLLSGAINPAEFMKQISLSLLPVRSTATFLGEMGKGVAFQRGGSRLLNVYRGTVKNPTAAEERAIQLINEGGLMPELDPEMRTRSKEKFMAAVHGKRASAVFHAPFAFMAHMQGIIFQQWIPSLKIASYLKDAEMALKADPTLMSDSERRLKTLNNLRKSVDNRYGEMSYNSLYWNKTVKDLAVLNTLSLGWQMGFLREYGGGAIDLAKGVTGKGSGVAAGGWDRPLFVAFYTTQALAYGGLLTWAMTGKQPESLKDYVYPRTGNKNPDGTDERTTTMFYTREFGSIYEHMKTEGAVKGLTDLVTSKSSGLFGLMAEWAKGVDSLGREIASEDAPAYKQLEQKLAHTWQEIEPISVRAKETTNAGRTRAYLGFGPAPKYVTQSATQTRIMEQYEKTHAPKETSFEKAQRSAEAKEVREAYASGDSKLFDEKLDAMQQKYKLTAGSIKQMVRGLAKGETGDTMMFKSLDWPEQKRILDKMTPEEREKYLPYIHKQFRQEYEDSLP